MCQGILESFNKQLTYSLLVTNLTFNLNLWHWPGYCMWHIGIWQWTIVPSYLRILPSARKLQPRQGFSVPNKTFNLWSWPDRSGPGYCMRHISSWQLTFVLCYLWILQSARKLQPRPGQMVAWTDTHSTGIWTAMSRSLTEGLTKQAEPLSCILNILAFSNSQDPGQMAPEGAIWSRSTQFAIIISSCWFYTYMTCHYSNTHFL